MLTDEVARFLSTVPPFSFLEQSSLRFIAGNVSMEFYPKGTTILRQDGPVSDSLRIVKKGGVKISIRTDGGGEAVVDYREAGETFGLVSLMGGRQKTTIVAVDDTICYLLPKKQILALIEESPQVTEYLLTFHFTKYADRTFREIRGKSLVFGSSDHVLFTTQTGDILRRGPVVVSSDLSIRETAERMSSESISSAVVLGADGHPAGIVTDRDLRRKVVAVGLDVSLPIRSIMVSPIISVDARDFCFEAVLKMIQHNIHHMPVERDGVIVGVLTNHDLMLLQGRSPVSFAEAIEHQTTVAGLAPVSGQVLSIIGVLLKEGARAGNIVRIISELNDRVVRKVLSIAEDRFGPPPVPYAWLALGSEGRKEQTFRTDQDNAIVFADLPDNPAEEAARAWFLRFASFVNDSLVACGFAPCPAGNMASNPEWCQPVRVWRRYFSEWIATPTPEAVMKGLIAFDFRHLHGEVALTDGLRDHLYSTLREHPVFLGFLANMLVKNRPPIGFFNSLVVEKGGEHKNELNLKVKGLAPLIDIVRLFALEKEVRVVPTVDRIEAMRGVHSIVDDFADEIAAAFEFLMLLRIHNQFRRMEAGEVVDNFVNPDNLSNLERRSTKDAFHLIARIQDVVVQRYRNFII